MAEYDLDFKDFSLPEAELQPKRFRVGDDTFTAPPLIAPLTLAELAGMAGRFGDMTGEDGTIQAGQMKTLLEAFGDFFLQLLSADDQSGERFKARLLSTQNPLDLQRQVIPIVFWLLEVYGLRPTQASSTSANGSDDAGPGSTDGAPNAESTP